MRWGDCGTPSALAAPAGRSRRRDAFLLAAWTGIALTLAGIVFLIAAFSAVADAPDSDAVPVARFACGAGVCWTTEAEFDRMNRLWNLMQQQIVRCEERRI